MRWPTMSVFLSLSTSLILARPCVSFTDARWEMLDTIIFFCYCASFFPPNYAGFRPQFATPAEENKNQRGIEDNNYKKKPRRRI